MQQENVDSSSEPKDENFDKFLALYHQCERKLLQYAQRISRPPITPDDVLQEAILHAMQKFSALRNKNKFASWFNTIIFRTYLRLLKKTDAERQRSMIYAERRLKEQNDQDAEIFKEIDSRLDKSKPGMTVAPHDASNTISQEIPKSRLSHVDEICREIIREGLESFNELQNKEDFHRWFEEKSKNVRKQMRNIQKFPKKRFTENENDGRE